MEKTRRNKKSYQCIRFRENTFTSYSELKELFEYEPQCFNIIPKPETNEDYYKKYEVGWTWENVKAIIDDVINNSAYNLICVSEDVNSITYHFIKN